MRRTMKTRSCLAAGALLLTVAGCSPFAPLASQYSESEAPKAVTLDNATARFSVGFVPGSSRLLPRDAARLRGLMARGAIVPSDRVTVAVGGRSALAAARFAEVSAAMLRYNIVPIRGSGAAAWSNRAVIMDGRYLVNLPKCPDWSKRAHLGYSNSLPSNFGCATATDLALSIWSPSDLAGGRHRELAYGRLEAQAVNNYLTGKVPAPPSASIGPIAAPSAGSAPGGSSENTP